MRNVTRRGFLSSSSALIGGAMAAGCSAPQAQNTQPQSQAPAAPPQMPLIGRVVDVHHHLYPESYAALAQSLGSTPEEAQRYRWKPEASLAAMDKIGIGTAMLSVSNWVRGAKPPSPEQLRKLCRECNEYGAKVVSDHPTRFGFFTSLMTLPDTDVTLKEIEYGLDTLKHDGVGLMSHYGENIYLGDERLDPVFAELNRRKVVAFVHPAAPWFDFRADIVSGRTLRASNKSPRMPSLGGWSLPFDTAMAIMNLLDKGTADKYPNIKFIFPHGGGMFMPLVGRAAVYSGKTEDGYKRTYAKLVKEISTFYFDLTDNPTKMIGEGLLAMTSPSHILFGSDIPRGPGRFTREELMEIPNIGFAAADLPGIARGNAEALFPRLKTLTT